jgi:prepilin-type N-terminal cleavage/methylation domain-containing protein
MATRPWACLLQGGYCVARRDGFTLFELMLVMMLILIAAALSIPAIDAMMADGRVKAARDMVRARWADIRGRAMKEGRPYQFSIISGTAKFKIEPEDPNAPSDTDEAPLILEGELPEHVLFNLDAGGTGSSAGSDYQTLAVYLADGTARDDVQIMFGRADAPGSIGLHLRALTGAVTAIDPAPPQKGP